MKAPTFEIVAGTYEEFLLGYYFVKKPAELIQSFASHDHSASIRSVAVCGNYLASGGADDRIIIYDLKSRKEHCMLTHHNTTVNCLKFTNNHSHLISCSTDGVLAIVRVGNWQLEKIWEKAHKGSTILDIAVHSSGKLALTLGSDCTLRTWNLVKGLRMPEVWKKIIWAEDDTRFILYGGKYTEVWSIESGGVLNIIEHNGKVTSCVWLTDDEILVGYETGEIALVNVNDSTKNIQTAHDSRVKAIAKYSKWVISCSSSGEIKVWSKKLKELAKHNSGCRITCLEIVPSLKIKEEKEEEVSEVVKEKLVVNEVKKSSVVVEVEGSDDETVILNDMDRLDSSDVKSKKKKHKSEKKKQTPIDLKKERDRKRSMSM
ncbi:hypothetical protein NQ318_020565 [Aromia moschata]|uniref:P21-activated protein kinase-interacting protein 1-like n=1 Tax=Aromia moschata TaxID=1265417 RepID=A0AAV8Z0K1_9CUCU|nr:hypothetical protein NQ318_020565 [Aromia moschata]